jgi:hypothetical protein
MIGKVLLDGSDICIRQIEDGFAWHFKKYEDEQPAMDQVRYSQAESDARAARVGLWRDPSPLAPWEFRAQRRGGAMPVSVQRHVKTEAEYRAAYQCDFWRSTYRLPHQLNGRSQPYSDIAAH